uniref:Nitric oxide synthase-interacting protein zinc-finger domain-containing protein n=1 Tax=Chromera velia CCMP2878 TaxID=1169474 RepID=A0A0G4HTX7_9ALVE|eukprot:Cvel_31584.t1-p1 / transcript=Cvel_31584.t1 / gene=Cvel_31584 / organism=Chromera_velia_CCMP2878 / gene_product=Nitric oxide synthase-interacting protein homolog, putative / transcript_product=Nitric oxide synthase-interacting protein homolog, putative / location=Cvel_scaffold4734:1123-4487(-) / protein_length=293 / sequence_SO=supercontig / SO=protein_coding / is_pseudo=false
MPTRHSKNNSAGAFFTYAERKKFQDVGSIEQRLGSESMRPFECCWLCLRPALKPVSTPDGFIYCKECILLNLARQRKEKDEELKKWEAYKALQQKAELSKGEEARARELAAFLSANESAGVERGLSGPSSSAAAAVEGGGEGGKNSKFIETNKAEGRAKNFWIQDGAPRQEGVVKEPSKSLKCPASGKPLKLKWLVDIKPETIMSGSEETQKWVCQFSKKQISHQAAAVIKETGQVFIREYLDKYVMGKKGSGFHPDDEKVLKESDVVNLVRGGTGFCAHNQVEGKSYRPVAG